MEIKLVILLVIASLARSSSGLKVSSGHSKNQSDVLCQILDNQKAAALAATDGWNLVFLTINKLAAKLTYNLHRECNVEALEFTKAAGKVKNSIGEGLDSVSLAVGKSCASVEAIRKTTYRDIDYGFTKLANALKLAHSGDYHKNRAAIEAYQAAAQNDWIKTRKTYVDSIRTCLNTTDPDTLAVIQRPQLAQSTTVIFNIVDNVYSAIKDYAAAVTTKRADISLLIGIEGFRCKALSAVQENSANKFSVLVTLSKCSRTHRKGIIGGLAVIDNTEMLSSNRFKAGYRICSDTLIGNLKRLALKMKADGKEDSCQTCDNAQARTVVRFKSGNAAFIASMLFLHPKSSATILATQEKLFAIEDSRANVYFGAINAAAGKSNNYPATVRIIEGFRNATVPLSPVFTKLYFDLIRNHQRFGEKIEAQLKVLQNEGVRGCVTATSNFFDAVEVLARANRAGKVSRADFVAVRSFLVVSDSGIDDFFQSVAAACTLVLKAKRW